MAHTFTIGQPVTNFGVHATVVGFHPVTGWPILREDSTLTHIGCGEWMADPAKCEPATTPVIHRDGLVAFF